MSSSPSKSTGACAALLKRRFASHDLHPKPLGLHAPRNFRYYGANSMSIRYAVLSAVFAALSLASGEAQVPKQPKNPIENGDFSAGIAHWTGDGKVDVFKSDTAGSPKAGTGLDALKPLAPGGKSLPPLPPVAATPAPPRPPLGAPPGKPNADVDRSYCVALGARSQKFSQRFPVPRNATVLRLTFRARPTDGFQTERVTLGAFQVKIQIPGGRYIYFDRKVQLDAEWQTFECNYTVTDPSRYLDLMVEVFPGTAQLYFDDFVIEGLEH